MEDTIFMKIVKKEIPADIVYEDEGTLAFLDIAPSIPGHTLVIPKKAVRNILDMDDATAEALIRSVMKVARAVKDGVSADGITIQMNNEPAGNQQVFHAHVHVIPRYENDGYMPGPGPRYAPGESEKIAGRIRTAFDT